MNGITVNGVSKRYGPLTVLGDITFRFEAGQAYALMGRSGVGKTTLLRLLAGLEPPSAGQIALVDKTASKAFCPQGDSLLPWLSAVENAHFPLTLAAQHRAKPHSSAANLIGRLGLSEFEAYVPSRLSGGMRQRVAIARTLITSPKILLFDEPFSALDDGSRKLAAVIISEFMTDTKATLIMATHRVEEVVLMADHLLVLGDSPAKIVSTHEINLPHPRKEDAAYWAAVTRLRGELSGRIAS